MRKTERAKEWFFWKAKKELTYFHSQIQTARKLCKKTCYHLSFIYNSIFGGHCTVISYINPAKLTLDNISKTLWLWVFLASSVGRGVTGACVAPAQGFPVDSSLQIMVQISSTLITFTYGEKLSICIEWEDWIVLWNKILILSLDTSDGC